MRCIYVDTSQNHKILQVIAAAAAGYVGYGMASLLLPALVCSKLLDVTDLRCGSWRMFPKANEPVQCCVQRTRNGFTGGVGALSGHVAAAEAGECDKQRTCSVLLPTAGATFCLKSRRM
ncbi:uncharacterized protein LOC119771241 [Culex quinquefasciatus]|uniref:uncharacterized protein LOC119771241 n=1 Tax=Culex quinquefasciatus TaxID=7176 RepID=UPI0018E34C66|nr:uncharacterized protein LOC119771241 [Culex quinquefasciatus]